MDVRRATTASPDQRLVLSTPTSCGTREPALSPSQLSVAEDAAMSTSVSDTGVARAVDRLFSVVCVVAQRESSAAGAALPGNYGLVTELQTAAVPPSAAVGG